MKIDKRRPLHWYLLLRQGVNTMLAAMARPFLPRPAMPIVVLYGHQLSGNLKALYQQWELSHSDEIALYFLALDNRYADELERGGVRVLRCHRLGDMLTVARASAMITDHGLHLMQALVLLTDIRFIDVWHGIPFKGFVPADFRLQHRYDEVWVTSPMLRELYVNKFGFNPERVLSLGYARVDRLTSTTLDCENFRQHYGLAPDTRVVLYAPTWKQDDQGRELFPFGMARDKFIQQLANTCQRHNAVLVIRSHLNADMDGAEVDHTIFCPMADFPDTEALLSGTDLLICDWSSIAMDFLVLERPTLFIDVTPPFKNGFSLGPQYRYGDVVADIPSLLDSLDQSLANPQSYLERRRNQHRRIARQLYTSDNNKGAARRQLDHLSAVLASNTP